MKNLMIALMLMVLLGCGSENKIENEKLLVTNDSVYDQNLTINELAEILGVHYNITKINKAENKSFKEFAVKLWRKSEGHEEILKFSVNDNPANWQRGIKYVLIGIYKLPDESGSKVFLKVVGEGGTVSTQKVINYPLKSESPMTIGRCIARKGKNVIQAYGEKSSISEYDEKINDVMLYLEIN